MRQVDGKWIKYSQKWDEFNWKNSYQVYRHNSIQTVTTSSWNISKFCNKSGTIWFLYNVLFEYFIPLQRPAAIFETLTTFCSKIWHLYNVLLEDLRLLQHLAGVIGLFPRFILHSTILIRTSTYICMWHRAACKFFSWSRLFRWYIFSHTRSISAARLSDPNRFLNSMHALFKHPARVEWPASAGHHKPHTIFIFTNLVIFINLWDSTGLHK